MDSLLCPQCGEKIEIDKVLEHQLRGEIEAKVASEQSEKHKIEMKKILDEQEALISKEREQAVTRAQARAKSDNELIITQLREDNQSEKESAAKLRTQLGELMNELRTQKRASEDQEIETQKKLAEAESKIREDVQKTADERARMNLAAKEKTITDLQKALDDAQRKAAQGSQQLQGEVLELDLEEALQSNFRDDIIAPVAKGVNGADIAQTVRSQSGIECGMILWEIKRTKNWTEGWIGKLKTDLRAAKANIPVIITEAVPKTMTSDLGKHDGVWIVKPKLALILAELLRKSLLDVAREKATALGREDKADALYRFVTSHEFTQQVESMVETYQEMNSQVSKERAAYERMWAQREKQAQKLLLNTSTIIGSIGGTIGASSLPKIKGLEIEFDDLGREPDSQASLEISEK